MRSFISAVVVVALTPVVFAQGPKINTVMNPTQCEPIQFTWQGGVPPFYLSLVPGGQPGGQPIRQFPSQSGNSMTWTVDVPAGTSFSSSLRDSTGEQAFSDIQTVQQGPESGCLNGSSTTTMPMTGPTGTNSDTSAASTETATTASVGAGAQKVISTTAASASATITGTVAHAASSASTTTATATSSNAASLHTSVGAIGFAGLLGLVGAALLG
ncbi:hypothetical protein VTO73DRAFT_13162 [Trametes versicolor]